MRAIEKLELEQEELDRRTAVEQEAINLISQCRFEEADSILATI